MKKQIILLIIALAFCNSFFAQSTDKLTQDEIARVKFSIHLITYDTIGSFESAAGEAYYKLVLRSFEENLTIPQMSLTNITANDKAITESIIQRLNDSKKNPPTWDELLVKETEYLKWFDKVTRRQSKYKIN